MAPTGYARRNWLTLAAVSLMAACKKTETASEVKPPSKEKEKEKSQEIPRDAIVVNELQLDYSIVLSVDDASRSVNEQFAFRNGDRFRFRLRPGFEAHIYLLSRGARQKQYTFLYPHKDIKQENPVPPKEIIEIPGSGTDWLMMDKVSGTEQLVLIASPSPLVEFNVPAVSIERDEFEERLGRVERDYRPTSSRRLETGGWVSILASRGPKTAMVVRLPLDHRL